MFTFEDDIQEAEILKTVYLQQVKSIVSKLRKKMISEGLDSYLQIFIM